MNQKRSMTMMAASLAAMMACSAAWAGPGGVPQASITLLDNAMALCHHNDTSWTLDKTGSYQQVGPNVGSGTVTWTVTATKGTTTPNHLDVFGYITIKNTGSANATIGNIVVNLQKRTTIGNNQYWISAAADCANGFAGDLATSAQILAAASQEDPNKNANPGPGNYTVLGQKGTFTEGPGSGSLSFMDAANNTVWAISPQKSLIPGESISLKWVAEFNNTVLQIPAGTPVRMEIIVSFGNAGERGGSGASACNQEIDINGNLQIDADEVCIRSVPARVSLEVPTLAECNKTVTLKDTLDDDMGTTGTVNVSNVQSDIANDGIEVLSDSAVKTIVATVTGGTAGGQVCNTAHLTGESGSILVGTNLFPCCVGVDLTKQSCVDVPPQVTIPPPPPPRFTNGEFCSFTQGGWGAKPEGGNPGALLTANFYTVYPPAGSGQVVIGGTYTITFKKATTQVVETIHGDGKPYDVTNTVTLEPWQWIEDFLPQGTTAGQLTVNLVNPKDSSAGVFGGQVLALELNVDFSAAGVKPVGLGSLVFQNTGTALDGLTVSQLLADCNTVLGGGTSAYGFTVEQLNAYADSVNNAFDNCVVTDWANTYLRRP